MNEPLTPEQQRAIDERRAAGKAGKLRTIEVLYKQENAVRMRRLINQNLTELFRFREAVFSVGLMVPVDPNKWIIVSPWDIISIDVYRQNYFIEQ